MNRGRDIPGITGCASTFPGAGPSEILNGFRRVFSTSVFRGPPSIPFMQGHAVPVEPDVPAPPGAHAPRGAWAVLKAVVLALALRELKTRLEGRWGGAVWVVGEPLANTALMLLVYGAMHAHTIAGVDTLLFLVSGQLPFLLFRSLALRLMDGIDANQGLFAYRQVQPIDAVIARAVVEVVLSLAVMLACALGLAWAGHDVLPTRPLEMALDLAILIGLGTSLGLLAAAGTGGAFVRLRGMVRMLFMPLYLGSGAIMPLAALPQHVREWLLWSPVAHLLESMRTSLFGTAYHPVDGVNRLVPLAWLLGLSTVALMLYRHRRDRLQSL